MYEETMAAVEQASAALDSRPSVYMELSNGRHYLQVEMSSLTSSPVSIISWSI